MLYMANFRIRLIQLSLGVLVLGASLIHPTRVHVRTLIFLGSVMSLSSLLSLEFLRRLFP